MYNEYEEIYEELCERVENEELTLEEAEVVNDYAYDLYVVNERAFNIPTLKNHKDDRQMEEDFTNKLLKYRDKYERKQRKKALKDELTALKFDHEMNKRRAIKEYERKYGNLMHRR